MKWTPKAFAALWLASLGVPSLGVFAVLLALRTNPASILLITVVLVVAQAFVLLNSFGIDSDELANRRSRATLIRFNLLAMLTYPTLLFVAIWISFNAMDGINSGI